MSFPWGELVSVDVTEAFGLLVFTVTILGGEYCCQLWGEGEGDIELLYGGYHLQRPLRVSAWCPHQAGGRGRPVGR